MFTLRPVDHLDHPELKPYRTMKAQRDHFQQNLFVAEGEKVVRRLLESSLKVTSCLMPHKWWPQFEALVAARPEPDIQVFVTDEKTLESITGFSIYQGVMAVGQIPQSVSLDFLLALPKPQLFVAVDGFTNAENMGQLVRNAAAFGVQGLIVGETSCSAYMRRSVRISMGTIFKLPAAEPPSLVNALQDLKKQGIHCVAAHPHTDQRYLAQARLDGPCCLVFGSEGFGISQEVLAVCDEWVAIPMSAGVDSLNVGSASAAFLYEVQRQRSR